jgi:hypothetical protein
VLKGIKLKKSAKQNFDPMTKDSGNRRRKFSTKNIPSSTNSPTKTLAIPAIAITTF